MHLILGSSSKSRAKILNDNNYEFLIMNPNINEKEIGNRLKDEPSALALAVANAKADALLPHIKDKRCILITCDQVVYHNHQIREKPESKQVFESQANN